MSEHFKLRQGLPYGDIASAVLCCLSLLVMFCSVHQERGWPWANVLIEKLSSQVVFILLLDHHLENKITSFI